ncbi:hypothetical protein A2230_09225 [candidate division WOR-1 bacterium RIFOXYA2_FULL_36_21]|uniref:Topo IIA-type catalytic domain-containing protein n=1 Tax=candidate division WOR-1 bacterium RIFOXYB2_FULL_36_35 TaxID=1802578 RepID=A0A1F4S0M0_UNCSA|nr:MAG: hypothetical protein A2230_09225 [candidate division WOR-1 bacterium RIFOXYA2_FULL_36_21]OGC13986.1 MAG: hypothetical protein A2290_04240 [candidate division WOR-1 bacterium RIFOXYB2_FULL_36_35]
MRLQKLTQLETEKIEEEYKELLKLIAKLKKILSNKKEILGLIKDELLAIKEKYGDERRTSIAGAAEDISVEELIPEQEVIVLTTRDGYVKRIPVNTFRAQLRGGRGIAGMATRDEDQIDKIFVSSTHSFVIFFTNKGKSYKVKVFELPEASRTGKGQSIANFLQVGEGERITASININSFEREGKCYFMMATTSGVVKKVEVSEFANIRRSGIIAIKLKGDDELKWVRETDGKQEVILGTAKGLMIRFNEKHVRAMGRSASGVRGIRVGKGDKVISMDIITPKGDLLAISTKGFGKRMSLKEFGAQSRGGKGHIAIKLRPDDSVASMKIIDDTDGLLFVTAKGTMSRQEAKGISTQGRYAKGVRIQRLDADDYIVGLDSVVKGDDEVINEKIAPENNQTS